MELKFGAAALVVASVVLAGCVGPLAGAKPACVDREMSIKSGEAPVLLFNEKFCMGPGRD